MGDKELTANGLGVRIFATDNDFRTQKKGKKGICRGISSTWIGNSMDEKFVDKKELYQKEVLGPYFKMIAAQDAYQFWGTGTANYLFEQRLVTVEPAPNDFKTANEMLSIMRNMSNNWQGFFYYSIDPAKPGDGHAMAFYIGKSKNEYYFLDPNDGLYRYAEFVHMAKNVTSHISVEYGESTHRIYKIVERLPKPELIPPIKVSLDPYIQTFKPNRDENQVYYEALLIYWLKRCIEMGVDPKEIVKIRDKKASDPSKKSELDAIKEIAMAGMSKPLAQCYKALMSKAGLKIVGKEFKGTFTPETVGDMADSILGMATKNPVLIWVNKRGGKTQTFLFAVVSLPSKSWFYCIDPSPILWKIPGEPKRSLTERFGEIFKHYRALDCEIYVCGA